jgi:hypothetical protein
MVANQTRPIRLCESQLRRHTPGNLDIGNNEEGYNGWIEYVNDEQYLKGD